MNDGVEHVVAVAFNQIGSVVSVYMDGAFVSSGSLPDIDTQGNSNFLGQTHCTNRRYFTGTIRRLRVYAYAMSSIQVLEQFSA